MSEKMNVYQKLMNVQKELKAPKNQFNSFGKYHYRSCEDILEGAKPVLSKYGACITLNDHVEIIGERTYMVATATFYDAETGEHIDNHAYARESDTKKGMDESQISGMASSYARKYCLNGLLLIDDTKDADTDEAQEQPKRRRVDEPSVPATITEKEKEILRKVVADKGYTVEQVFPKGIDTLTSEQYGQAMQKLAGMKNR